MSRPFYTFAGGDLWSNKGSYNARRTPSTSLRVVLVGSFDRRRAVFRLSLSFLSAPLCIVYSVKMPSVNAAAMAESPNAPQNLLHALHPLEIRNFEIPMPSDVVVLGSGDTIDTRDSTLPSTITVAQILPVLCQRDER